MAVDAARRTGYDTAMDRLALLGVMSAVLYASRPCETWGPDVREDVMDECELLLDELECRVSRSDVDNFAGRIHPMDPTVGKPG